MTASTSPDAKPAAEQEQNRTSLIEYPCMFPIKVMGPKVDHFVHTILEVTKIHDPFIDASAIELRESSAGHYLGITLMVHATSKVQLDALYQALSSHPMVKVVL